MSIRSVCNIKNQGLLARMKDLVYYQVMTLEILCQKYLC